MADQPDYKHITVNPAEDDDIVIHAGAVGAADTSIESVEAAEAANVSDAADVADEANAAADAQDTAYAKEDAAEGMVANVVLDAAPRDTYQRTTLDDIQSSKMPRTQIVVIAVAVVAIIAFAVRYVFFS